LTRVATNSGGGRIVVEQLAIMQAALVELQSNDELIAQR